MFTRFNGLSGIYLPWIGGMDAETACDTQRLLVLPRIPVQAASCFCPNMLRGRML